MLRKRGFPKSQLFLAPYQLFGFYNANKLKIEGFLDDKTV